MLMLLPVLLQDLVDYYRELRQRSSNQLVKTVHSPATRG
jgi:hypothetical protein